MKNEEQVREDLNGRLHSLDQNLRSVEKRLRAVERRLSVDIPSEDTIPEYENDLEETIEETRTYIASILTELDKLKQNSPDQEEIEIRILEMSSEISELNSQIKGLQKENKELSEQIEQQQKNDSQGYESLSAEMQNEISRLRILLEKIENRNRINIGSVKVPVELSGIIGALILAITGYLIMEERWDIIRSANFSFGIAFVFAAAVLLKFYIVNRNRT